MEPELIIRGIQPRDGLRAIGLLEKGWESLPSSAGIPFDPARADRLIDALVSGRLSDVGAFVLASGGEAVGCALVQRAPLLLSSMEAAGITILYVFPEYRSFRAAALLMDACRKWASERGAKLVYATLDSGQESVRTTRLFERLGFRSVGAQMVMRS